MHPLQPDLTVLTDHELDENIKTLTKRYFTVLNVSPSASFQVVMLLEGYKEEQQNRQFRRQEEMKRSLGTDFDDLINIG
jgi:menaquinone-dependent protoporphyrinogen IX oxidase